MLHDGVAGAGSERAVAVDRDRDLDAEDRVLQTDMTASLAMHNVA